MVIYSPYYRFWIPEEKRYIYPEDLYILLKEDGSRSYIVDGEDIENIDPNYKKYLRTPFKSDFGEVYEGDYISFDGTPRKLEARIESFLSDRDPEDPSIIVDFGVSFSEDGFIPITNPNERFEVLGDINEGFFIAENPLIKKLAQKRQEEKAKLESKISNDVSQETSNTTEQNTSDPTEYKVNVNSRQDFYDDEDNVEEEDFDNPDGLNSDYDNFAESEEDDEEYLEEDEEDLNNKSSDFNDIESEDISNDKPIKQITIEEALNMSKSSDESKDFADEEEIADDEETTEDFDIDSDEDFLWDDSTTDLIDTVAAKLVTTTHEVYIKTVLNRERKIGGWAFSVFRRGESISDSGALPGINKKELEMTALYAALREIKCPSIIRTNLDNGFLKKLLEGKEVTLQDDLFELKEGLLDLCEPHTFIFIEENPFSIKVESKIAKRMAEEACNE